MLSFTPINTLISHLQTRSITENKTTSAAAGILQKNCILLSQKNAIQHPAAWNGPSATPSKWHGTEGRWTLSMPSSAIPSIITKESPRTANSLNYLPILLLNYLFYQFLHIVNNSSSLHNTLHLQRCSRTKSTEHLRISHRSD